MKKHMAILLYSICTLMISMAVLMGAGTVYGAGICGSYSGSNVNSQNYATYGKTVKSYLSETDDGRLMRFQADAVAGKYLVEYYDLGLGFLGEKTISEELPIFGAFYDDGKYYYVLSGQENMSENDGCEVYRITKYSHKWKRLASVAAYGYNTTIPFEAGSARMVHKGKLLFIRTCHQMYASSNGKRHQANVTIEVNTTDMAIVDSLYGISCADAGYVSHSFNQFIGIDDGRLVTVDHGDAYPRSVVLMKYNSKFSSDGFKKATTCKDLISIPGSVGDNFTGMSIGGFEISESSYLTAGNMVDLKNHFSSSGTRNIFVAVQDRSLSSGTTVNAITSYEEGSTSASTPQLVEVSSNEYILLWTRGSDLYCCRIDGKGNRQGKICKTVGALSDCQPVLVGSDLIWYTWENNHLTFYSMNMNDLSQVYTLEYTYGGSHSYDSDVLTQKASPDADGKICSTCRNCGAVKEKTLAKPSTFRLSETSYSYDGKIKSPALEVYDSQNKLIDASNYEVIVPDGRKKIGTYTYTIIFNSASYTGTGSVSFKINPKETSLKSVTAKSRSFKATWTKRTSQTSGYQLRYSQRSNMSTGVLVTVKDNTTKSITVKGLTSKKTYYVQVRTYKTMDGVNYVSKWSSTAEVTVK